VTALRLAGSRGADVLVRDHFCVKPGETVAVTADSATDAGTIEAVVNAAAAAGAKPLLLTIPQLPFQGTLADPYIPEALGRAVSIADVWFDLTFPYLAGSQMHDKAMKAGRARYLLIGDVKAAGLDRLYGAVDLDRLFAVQEALDGFLTDSEGAECRITSPVGTDITLRLGRITTKKRRRTDVPGTSTVMGSAIFYPVPETVRGEIVLEAMFHEFYTILPEPIRLTVDDKIRELRGGGAHRIVADRALRRAAGGDYGRIIHLTIGFHPAAQFVGASFVEDIRSVGANAIGLGLPWWEPGGGENHPDAVVTAQSVWIGGRQIVRDGLPVYPGDLQDKLQQLVAAAGWPSAGGER